MEKRGIWKRIVLLFSIAALFMAQTVSAKDYSQAETVNSLEEQQLEEVGAAPVPANPVHHCTKESDGSDYTDWSYVYFGSYPQTEVTGDELTAAITEASYDENGDAWIDGTKYRRISKNDTNYGGYFGNSEYRYFKWERIKWRVLKNDGETLFVVADKGLDCKNYNETYTSITWEDCTLRSWLNNNFYSTAFSSKEQDAIVEQIVANEDNPNYGTEGGNDTMDNIFLLSIGEVTNPEYGFCESYSTYSASRWTQASDYAHAMGASVSTSSGYEGNCWWWLRSPGYGTSTAARVNDYGFVYRTGYSVDTDRSACVPALHMNLSSDLWYLTDDGSSGEGGDGENRFITNPIHHCTGQDDGTDTTDWSYVYFGSYPQTEVTGDELTTAITEASYDANGDAWIDGTKYRRISKEDTNSTAYFGDSEYRYFKWERIKWRVLKNDGETLFVVADKGLDCKNYNETYTSITWEDCTLRSWLNNNFYSTAFSSKEQDAIVEQIVANEDNPDYGTEGGNDTTDNIFLLSIGEVTNPEYGFCESYSTYSASRRAQASDYAHAMGASVSTSSGYEGNCWWWLRSPGSNTDCAAIVDGIGDVDRYGYRVSDYGDACVPALHMNLSSDLWYLTDDGSSGEGGDGENGETTNPNPETEGSQNTGTGGNQNTGTGGSQNTGTGGSQSTGTGGSQSTGTGGSKAPTASKPATQTIKASSFTKEYGSKPFSIKASTNGNGKLTYQSSNKKVATVSSKGKVTLKGYGTATVTIRASQTSTYKAASKKITVKVIPKKTALKAANSPGKRRISLKWAKNKNIIGYEIYISSNQNFKSHTIKRSYPKSKTSVTMVGLSSRKKYYVKIRSYTKVGKKKYYSNWSKAKQVKIK